MAEPDVSAPRSAGSRPFADLAVDALFAGLLGAGVVAVVFLIHDVLEGSPLHTPSVLGAYLFLGAEAARTTTSDVQLAAAYNLLHVLGFLLGGLLISWVVVLVERSPWFWYPAFVALVFVLGAILYLDGAFGVPGLGRFHLAVAAVLGSSSMLALLLWRHPGIAQHLDDVWKD